ncbi:MAG: 2-C-methyl-D-erythritol 4-phosphate cytidylyltransferase [Akkermansiaceae bacterium]|nr:2-C-methyl-D-erythritol 4-phosphate cytidylyltransferase [Akkermansiaceae bacterium]
MSCAAIIVAAGRSRRMGADKLLLEAAGRPLLQWTLDAFVACGAIKRVVVVCPEERFAQLETAGGKEVVRVDGGRERFLSVVEGLGAVSESLVAVHDGARPLVQPAQIEECVAAARAGGAAVLARRVTETLKYGSRDGFTRGSVAREDLWAMETPQVFRTKVLKRAYEHVLQRRLPVTDDVSAAEAIGVATKLVENHVPNLKVTTPADLQVAGELLRARE